MYADLIIYIISIRKNTFAMATTPGVSKKFPPLNSVNLSILN